MWIAGRTTFMLASATVALAALAAPPVAGAHHVVWLDFSQFTLAPWTATGGVNGHTPPTAADVAAVRALIVANIVEDYAPFDIYFTTIQPENGRHSRILFTPTNDEANEDDYSGCSQSTCCTSCTGHGSWDTTAVSRAKVYLSVIAQKPALKGGRATTARLANYIALTASHELGHLLGLEHFHGADDAISRGCVKAPCSNTNDEFVEWHIMSFAREWDLITSDEAATRNFFFNAHSERRVLYSRLQARNHWSAQGDFDGGTGGADLLSGTVRSSTAVDWNVHPSSGSAFGGSSTWGVDAGDPGDLFLAGDVDGDKRSDLVYGHAASSTQIRWRVRLSTESGFGNTLEWGADGGNVGDVFRLADVNGDGLADLVLGRPLSADIVRWYVRLSTGTSFGNHSTWASDAGRDRDLFFFADVDADGDADLVLGQPVSATLVRWYVRPSTGTSFGASTLWCYDAGDVGDLFYVGDADGDGDADLVYGRMVADRTVKWFFRPSVGNGFGVEQVWQGDAGNAGDLFRLGDGDGDGRLDLVYGRPSGIASLTEPPDLTTVQWYRRRSLGGSFGDLETWSVDAGDEGDLFPE